MKRDITNIVIGFVGLMLAALPCGRLAAWQHANYHGGTTTHNYGSDSTTRTDAWGGSETHTYGRLRRHRDAPAGVGIHKFQQSVRRQRHAHLRARHERH